VPFQNSVLSLSKGPPCTTHSNSGTRQRQRVIFKARLSTVAERRRGHIRSAQCMLSFGRLPAEVKRRRERGLFFPRSNPLWNKSLWIISCRYTQYNFNA